LGYRPWGGRSGTHERSRKKVASHQENGRKRNLGNGRIGVSNKGNQKEMRRPSNSNLVQGKEEPVSEVSQK